MNVWTPQPTGWVSDDDEGCASTQERNCGKMTVAHGLGPWQPAAVALAILENKAQPRATAAQAGGER